MGRPACGSAGMAARRFDLYRMGLLIPKVLVLRRAPPCLFGLETHRQTGAFQRAEGCLAARVCSETLLQLLEDRGVFER